MTNSEYIEVVEKVWGFELSKNPNFYRSIWTHPSEDETMIIHDWDIEGKVNSWQGFGRTVEAMAKRGCIFIADDIYIGFILESKRHVERQGPPAFMWSRQLPRDSLNNFIEETHLAALEAVREEK